MNAILGDNNFLGILGEILLINIELDTKSIYQLFDCKEKYAYIINNNKFRNDLIINKIHLSRIYKDTINHFKNLKFDCLIKITPKSLISKNNYENNELIEYNTTCAIEIFLKEKGI